MVNPAHASIMCFGRADTKVLLTRRDGYVHFLAERSVLMEASEYFRAALRSNCWKEGQSSESISLHIDVSPEAFSLFLAVIHCEPSPLTLELVGDLLLLGDRLLADCVRQRVDKWVRYLVETDDLMEKLETEHRASFLQMLVDFRLTGTCLAVAPILARNVAEWELPLQLLQAGAHNNPRVALLENTIKRAQAVLATRKSRIQIK